MTKKKIIVVDDNPANLNACKKTLKDLYDVFPAPSAEKMFEIMTHIIPDLILLDVEMPGTNGYEAIRVLKSNNAYKEIPVMFLSAMDDAQSEMEGLDLGAADYIHKPFVSALLIKRIETHISVIEGKKELVNLNRSIKELLTPKINETKPRIEAEEEAIKDLLTKESIIFRMGHEIRASLNNIVEMIELSIKSNDIDVIKQCLGKADVETRLILEIINGVLDMPENGG
ncbi:MAG: response regulator [Chitinispirillales bacterium]|jgi:DNA-binding response OmpR family regulator|nr:response regulator [Chitinispirillales bacterium]